MLPAKVVGVFSQGIWRRKRAEHALRWSYVAGRCGDERQMVQAVTGFDFRFQPLLKGECTQFRF